MFGELRPKGDEVSLLIAKPHLTGLRLYFFEFFHTVHLMSQAPNGSSLPTLPSPIPEPSDFPQMSGAHASFQLQSHLTPAPKCAPQTESGSDKERFVQSFSSPKLLSNQKIFLKVPTHVA